MSEKEPRDLEASSSAEPPPDESPEDATSLRRQQFSSWVQSLQHKARAASSAPPAPITSAPPPAPSVTRAPLDSDRAPQFHHIPEELLREARAMRDASRPTAGAPTPPPAPAAAPIDVSPVHPPFIPSFREELPAEERTAVFSPSPELLVRSGRQPASDSAWEEPTRVAYVGNVLEALATATQPPPPPIAEAGPEQQPEEIQEEVSRARATTAPPAKRTRWLLWAFAAVLAGALTAAFAEYSLHPPPARAPGSVQQSR